MAPRMSLMYLLCIWNKYTTKHEILRLKDDHILYGHTFPYLKFINILHAHVNKCICRIGISDCKFPTVVRKILLDSGAFKKKTRRPTGLKRPDEELSSPDCILNTPESERTFPTTNVFILFCMCLSAGWNGQPRNHVSQYPHQPP